MTKQGQAQQWPFLTPPVDLIQRLRWMFLVANLVILAIILPLVVAQNGLAVTENLLAIVASVLMAIWWFVSYRLGRIPLWALPLEGVLVGLMALPDTPSWAIWAVYLGGCYRALFNNSRQSILVGFVYVAAYVIGLMVSHDASAFGQIPLRLLPFPLALILMRFLLSTVRQFEATRLDLKQAQVALEERVVERTDALMKQIAEREAIEATMRSSEERYRFLYEKNPSMYFTLDAAGIVRSVNPFGAEQLGYQVHDLVGQSVLALFPAEVHKAVLIQIEECAKRPNEILHWEITKIKRDGSLIFVKEAARAVINEHGETVILIVCEDVTDRKMAEQALLTSEARYRDLVENAKDVIYSHDLTGRFTSVNAAGEALMGYNRDEISRLNIANVVAPEHLPLATDMVKRKLGGEGMTVYDLDVIAKGGRRISLEISTWLQFQDGKPIGIQGIARDVSERKVLEHQLQQAQKMEAVGRLAGGVAHDFNNLLTAINGFSQLLESQLGNQPQLASYAAEIRKAGAQAAALTGQLLAFGRRQMLQPKVLDLNAIVLDMDKMLRRLIGEDIELITVPDQALHAVRADLNQVQQVVLNLAVNARDAMPQGGKLTIETRNVVLDEAYTRHHVGVTPGAYVLLAVSDTGHGMDRATMAHIFEPFFTTKPSGKGTGLGLATVYGIVQQSGGHLAVYSELGRGTTFKVYLPEVQAAVDLVAPAKPDSLTRGAETILLCEDEPVVRSLASEVLKTLGYNVLVAEHPDQALALAAPPSVGIDLLLTDVVMPRMNGRELAQRLTAQRPGLKVLFMSGYADQAVIQHGMLPPGSDFMSKPFAPDALGKKIRALLQEDAAPVP